MFIAGDRPSTPTRAHGIYLAALRAADLHPKDNPMCNENPPASQDRRKPPSPLVEIPVLIAFILFFGAMAILSEFRGDSGPDHWVALGSAALTGALIRDLYTYVIDIRDARLADQQLNDDRGAAPVNDPNQHGGA